MSLLPPRLTEAQLKQAVSAGMLLPRATKASFFGSMFSFFGNSFRGSFWPVGGNAKPPVNSAVGASGQTVTPSTAMTVSAAWACVWLTARTMASMPLELKRYEKSGAGKLDEGNPLYSILRWQPNKAMTAYEFWTCMWASVLLWGNGYALKRRIGTNVVALDFLLPEYVTVYFDAKGLLRYRSDDPQSPADYAAEDVFHLRERTLDGISGASIIEFARNSLGLAQSGELAASKTFKKGLNASGFIKVDKFLKKDQREDFRSEIDKFATDSENAGGTMVLEGGVTYTQLSMKPQDAELLQSRQFSVEDVCRWFGTPPILIGHASAGQTMWGSGLEQIFRGWLNLALRPYITSCTQAVRSSLILPVDRASTYAEYDLDDLLAADSQARATLYASYTQNGIKTRDEIREKEGLGPMPGGDVLTVQSNLVPLDQLGAAASSANASTAQDLQKALAAFIEQTALLKAAAVQPTPTPAAAPPPAEPEKRTRSRLVRHVIERDAKGRAVGLRTVFAEEGY